jgi:hypothetical protein
MEFEFERLGCEIGDVFASASNDIWTPSVLTTMASLSETVSKLRYKNPGLVKAKQWRFFEDLFSLGAIIPTGSLLKESQIPTIFFNGFSV